MKNKYFLLIVAFLYSASADAQISRLIATTKTRYNGTDFLTIGDSTYYIYSGARDTANNGGVAFDSAYVLVAQPGYTTGNLSYRYFQGFGGTNNIDSITSQYFDTTSTSWVNNQFEVNAYNADNNLTNRILMNWDPPSVSWVNNSKTTNTYTGLNNILKIVQNWSAPSAAWVNATKDSFGYDASSNMIYHLAQKWDTSALIWKNTNQYFDTFNATNEMIKSMRQSWGNAASIWKNNTFTLYDYTAATLLSNTIVQHWDSALSAWINNTGDSLLYSAASDIATEINLNWDSAAHTWKNVNRYEYTYDANHNLLTDTLQNWVTAGGGRFANSKLHLYNYNTYNQVLVYTTETWNTAPPAWTYHLGGPNTDVQYRYYYDIYPHIDTTDTTSGVKNLIAGSATLNVSPNPSNGAVNIKLNWDQLTPFSVAVYDINGDIVRRWDEAASKNYNRTITVSDLPSGTYFIKVRGDQKQLIQRFIVIN